MGAPPSPKGTLSEGGAWATCLGARRWERFRFLTRVFFLTSKALGSGTSSSILAALASLACPSPLDSVAMLLAVVCLGRGRFSPRMADCCTRPTEMEPPPP